MTTYRASAGNAFSTSTAASKRDVGLSVDSMLLAVFWIAGALFVGSITFAVLTEVQSDYLGALSESAGGFNPAVFPPYESLTWILAMATPAVTGALLVLVALSRKALRGRS